MSDPSATITLMEECVYCEGMADFIQIEGGWYVCASCIKDGETDVGINERI